MWTDYYQPRTIDETLELLAKHAADPVPARLIAGGTDLLIELERGARLACALIDVSRLDPSAIALRDGEVHLGPLTTHADVVGSALCVERAFPLAQACRQVGAPQIRNRATVAGNLVTASPANDTITPLIALGARVTLRSRLDTRALPLDEFYLGVRKTALRPGEMLTDIAFPALTPNQRGAYLKLGLRRAQAISLVNCAVVLTFDAGVDPTAPVERGVVRSAAIALGAVAPTIIRAAEAERSLEGAALSDATIARAADLARRAARPISDLRASADYRTDMVGVLVARALTELMRGSERGTWSEDPALLSTAAGSAAPAAPDAAIAATINGLSRRIEGAGDKTLLRMLREDCGLIGTKEGCAEGECGACTVILDGKAVMACLVPAPRAHGAEIVTVEGVGGGALHPLQQAFIDAGAVQCGYCTPGFIMSGVALFAEHTQPNEAQIRESISGNLCRCTGYYAILDAFRRAADSAA